ncbi:MAG: 1-phosphofructokinase [Lachnospiraceae bacterium]|nr:1-phosphofructokinase [Lachnospiraceae bacterium]
MIYTVTFNPSLDYIVSVDHFHLGDINRTSEELLLPGGKGINVSMVLSNLGLDSMALGFMAGFTGQEIVRLLEERKVKSRFITVSDGISRINVKLRSDQESEINGMGPQIGHADIQKLYTQLDKLKKDDILVISGSIPASMPETMYSDIMRYLSGRGIRTVVDADGDLLMNVLEYEPFLVKPNDRELGRIFDVKIKNRDEVIPYAKKMQKKGAKNVLVSMAKKGAILVTENGKVYQSDAPKGEVKNSVGAGDAMVAGFLAGYIYGNGDYDRAFYTGLCAGSASAFSDELADDESVRELLAQMGKHY